MIEDRFTAVAEQQFDEIYDGPDIDMANAVADACDLILNLPGEARKTSDTLRDGQGRMIMMYPVPGYPPLKIFWITDGPRVEAIFERP